MAFQRTATRWIKYADKALSSRQNQCEERTTGKTHYFSTVAFLLSSFQPFEHITAYLKFFCVTSSIAMHARTRVNMHFYNVIDRYHPLPHTLCLLALMQNNLSLFGTFTTRRHTRTHTISAAL